MNRYLLPEQKSLEEHFGHDRYEELITKGRTAVFFGEPIICMDINDLSCVLGYLVELDEKAAQDKFNLLRLALL